MATDSSLPSNHDVRVALRVQPWLHARPGAGFTLTCRLRNETADRIAGALLRFMLPLEVVVGADEPAVLALAGLEPHADLTVERDIHLHPSTINGAELRFEAVLNLPDGRLRRSNVAAVPAHNRAELIGPSTFVEIQHAQAPREIVVSAHVSNHGTAPALGIRLDLPLPAGTVSAETSAPTTFVIDRLDAGESRVVSYRTAIGETALRCVRVAGANIIDATGTRIALDPSHPLALRATLTAPSVTATRSGRRVHVTLRGSNVDAGAAHDVEFRVSWPADFRCNVPSLTYNAARVIASDRHAAFARADVGAQNAAVTVAAIDAGESYELAFDLDALPGARSGTIVADVRALDTVHHTQAVLTWVPRSDVRLRVVSGPDDVGGRSGRVVMEIFNAGDDDAQLTLHSRDADVRWTVDCDSSSGHCAPIAVAAGERRTATVHVDVPTPHGGSADFTLHIIARSQEEEDVGHCRVVFAADASEAFGAAGASAVFAAGDASVGTACRSGPNGQEVGRATAFGEHSEVTFFVKLDRAQIATWVRRLSQPTGEPGILSHLCSLGSLFPTGVRSAGTALFPIGVRSADYALVPTGVRSADYALVPTGVHSADYALSRLLRSAGESFERLLDRVALKARMPGFTPTPEDFYDVRTLDAMRALLSAMAGGSAIAPSDDVLVAEISAPHADGPWADSSWVDTPWAQTQVGAAPCAKASLTDAPCTEASISEASCSEAFGANDPHTDALWLEATFDRSWAGRELRRVDQTGPRCFAALSCALAILPRSAAGLDEMSLALGQYVASLHKVLHLASIPNAEVEREAGDARARLACALVNAVQRVLM